MTAEPPGTGRKRPTWAQGLLLAGGGLVAAVGGCATFIAIDNLENILGIAGGLVFVIGAVTVPVGGGMFVYGVIKAFVSGSGVTDREKR